MTGLIVLSGCSTNFGSYEGGYDACGGFETGAAEETNESAAGYTAENLGTGTPGETLPAYTYFGRFDLPEGDIISGSNGTKTFTISGPVVRS